MNRISMMRNSVKIHNLDVQSIKLLISLTGCDIYGNIFTETLYKIIKRLVHGACKRKAYASICASALPDNISLTYAVGRVQF